MNRPEAGADEHPPVPAGFGGRVTLRGGQLEHGHRAAGSVRAGPAGPRGAARSRCPSASRKRRSSGKRIPKVWTLRQRGISRPAPARSPGQQGQAEQAAEPSRRDRDLEAEQLGARSKRAEAHSGVSTLHISFGADGVRGPAPVAGRPRGLELPPAGLPLDVRRARDHRRRRGRDRLDPTSCSPTSPRRPGIVIGVIVAPARARPRARLPAATGSRSGWRPSSSCSTRRRSGSPSPSSSSSTRPSRSSRRS